MAKIMFVRVAENVLSRIETKRKRDRKKDEGVDNGKGKRDEKGFG